MLSQIIIAIAMAVSGTGESTGEALRADKVPPHQVVAIYFHRTVRCPTCKRIGTLAEEAVKKSFSEEMKAGRVEFRYVDFQSAKNADITKAYKIGDPTLVLQSIVDGNVVKWSPLPKVWSLAAKPVELQAYVQQGVSSYLKQAKQESESTE